MVNSHLRKDLAGEQVIVSLSTTALTALLALGLSAAASSRIVQEHRSESEQIDQVDVTRVTGTIEEIDPDEHVLTIKLNNGLKKTLKVDKSVKDLAFTRGDRVKVGYARGIIVMAEYVGKGATQQAKYVAVDIEAEGEKPALVKVDTSEVIGKIVSIDPMKRRLKFEDPDGKKRSVKLSYRIKDLDRFKPGDTINMAVTEEIVVEVYPLDFTR
jgi:hypothetical protein